MKNKILILLLTLLCFSVQGFAQNILVKGKILDENNEPLMGATVFELGSQTNGVVTDLDGNFVLTVKSEKSQLKVNYIGFVEKIVRVRNTMMKVILSEDSKVLDEVVVVGYGRQKKITSVGSISEIRSDELRQTPSASLQNSLAGKVPGLFQQQTSGQPGADAANIYIRGVSTFNAVSKAPLVLVDDVETSYEIFTQMDSNEVESISLLKDASSTAIYGVKGANGVILVTTRRGTDAKPRISYRAEFGLQNPT
ncbi:MAG: TonB-dependent receptor plug domain-containing protein, partial [Bacteroides sp.]